MKVLLSLITALISVGAYQSRTSNVNQACPIPDGPISTYFPSADNCATFYQCSNGVAFLFVCPGGLVFDPSLNVCNWPAAVEGPCGSNSVQPTTKAPTVAPTEAPTDTPTEAPTAPELQTDAPTLPPTAPEQHTDAPTLPPTGTEEVPDTDSPTDQAQETDPPTDAPTEPAPATEAPTDAPVDIPTDAETEPEPQTNAPTHAPTVVPPTRCPSFSDTVPISIPHEKHCRLYYRCENGDPDGVLQECPPGNWFSFTLQVCTRPRLSGCQHGANKTSLSFQRLTNNK